MKENKKDSKFVSSENQSCPFLFLLSECVPVGQIANFILGCFLKDIALSLYPEEQTIIFLILKVFFYDRTPSCFLLLPVAFPTRGRIAAFNCRSILHT